MKWKTDPLEQIVENSYRNFHAKGFDYLCLQRSPGLTLKAYFFDGVADTHPDVVCPHNHRYPFTTTVIAGSTRHYRYMETSEEARGGPDYQCFEWYTPLNGGKGFSWARETQVVQIRDEVWLPGDTYFCRAAEVHTINVDRDTILLIHQLEDVAGIDVPTLTYVRGDKHEPPPLAGLYDRMTEDRANQLLARLAMWA